MRNVTRLFYGIAPRLWKRSGRARGCRERPPRIAGDNEPAAAEKKV
jgi:hypothetical protein